MVIIGSLNILKTNYDACVMSLKQIVPLKSWHPLSHRQVIQAGRKWHL